MRTAVVASLGLERARARDHPELAAANQRPTALPARRTLQAVTLSLTPDMIQALNEHIGC
jgi:hypothetical protein